MPTIEDIVARLDAISVQLRADDGVAAFDRVYLEVTRSVRDHLSAGFFDDPAFMTDLDVRFAGLFLAAVDADAAGTQVSRPWAPLFEARSRGGIEPAQFVIAGMNAHINNDLALALVATCVARARTPQDVLADYERVNELLAALVRPVRQSLLDPVVVDAGRPMWPLADLISSWSIDKARDAAWLHAETLFEVRDLDWLTRAYEETLGSTVGLLTCQLLLALPDPP
ncbi:MAG: DUF5995 family protein [Actinomycetes bacterium]